MKKLILIFIIITVITTGCLKINKSEPQNKIVHLRNIPTEVTFHGSKYKVDPSEVEKDKVGDKIGTTDNNQFIVYKIKNITPEREICLLVREEQPTIYYKAIKE